MSFGKQLKIIIAAVFFTAVLFGNLSALEQTGNITKRVGLFIGSNNGGRDRVMLRYAVSDAKSVSGIFGDMGGIASSDNTLLVEPTVAEINRRLDSLDRELASARQNNQRTELVFYYSGHSDEEGLLLNRERYSYRDLRERINRIDTDIRIVILDSCASGAITRAKGGVKAPPFLFDSSVSAEGYAFLTSSSASETSQESDSIESSYFTHSLVAGLRGAADTVGDGKVTLNELYRFAYAETLAKTETSIHGAQHPSYDMQLSGTGDVVLTDIKETSASLLLGEDVTGRISIRDSSDFLVVELTKVNQKPLELGLEPGLYRITVQKGDNFYRAEIQLRENSRASLGMDDFSQVASASGDRNRGDDQSSDAAAGEEPAAEGSGTALYTVFVNIVSEPFRYPLFGFVNIARGNFTVPQFGFVNWNTGNFSSLQASFINTTIGNFSGLQAGFINTSAGNTRGLQWGFINTTLTFYGAQLGFVNTAIKESQGLQGAFVNISAQKFKGVQLGFVNYADSIENGVPVGFISIVRHGGYHAVEYSFSEFFPFNVGLKLGVEKFYTSFYVAYNSVDEFALEHFAAGFGIGSILPISGGFFFNPELNCLSLYHNNGQSGLQFISLIPYFGFKAGQHFSITAGPSVTWEYASNHDDTTLRNPLFKIQQFDINGKNTIVIGARAAVRVLF